MYCRSRSIYSTTSCNALLGRSALVIPLHHFIGNCCIKHSRPVRSLSREETGRRVALNYRAMHDADLLPDVLADAGQEAVPADAQTTERGKGLYRQILGIRTVHYLAIFALIYIGVEVTVGGALSISFSSGSVLTNFREYLGWIVTFIIREREGGHSAGYISSGFFGGEHARVQLLYLHAWRRPSQVWPWVDSVWCGYLEKWAFWISSIHVAWISILSSGGRTSCDIPICLLGNCVCMIRGPICCCTHHYDRLEVTIWVVPSIIENAVAVSTFLDI